MEIWFKRLDLFKEFGFSYISSKEETSTKTETTSEDASWFYVNSSNQQMGPYTEEEMVQFIKEGIITANTYVWKSGMMDWIHCKDSTLFDRRSGSGGFNNYANGNTNKIFIETRSIPVCIILSIVTCGIYNLYWIYRLAKDVNTLNAAQQNQQDKMPEWSYYYISLHVGYMEFIFIGKSENL